MDDKVNIQLEELFIMLDNSSFIKEFKRLCSLIKNNTELVNDIEKIQSLNKYDPLYKELRLKIYSNEDYKLYMKYYQELNLLIMKFNKELNSIIGGRSCESN